MNGNPMTTNATSTPILRSTSSEFVPADSRMPIARSAEKPNTDAKAMTSKYVCACASYADVAHTGKWRPTLFKKFWMFDENVLATGADAMPYSQIRFQPMIQAMSSPTVAYVYV